MRSPKAQSHGGRPAWQFTLRGLFGLTFVCSLWLATLVVLPQFFASADRPARAVAASLAAWSMLAVVYLKKPFFSVVLLHWCAAAATGIVLIAAFVMRAALESPVAVLAEGCLIGSLISCPVFVFRLVAAYLRKNRCS